MIQALGICLVAMGVISVAIFEFFIRRGGIKTVMDGGHVTTVKGKEYETLLTLQYRGASWIDTGLAASKIEASRQMQVEPLSGGKLRLRFLGKYAGRTDGVRLGITLTDPLGIKERLEEVAHVDFVLDTLPASLFASNLPNQQRRVYGFGEQATGYPGAGQELYGLEEYNAATDTKNIVWKRVAKSPNESLIASLREGSVKDVIRVGVVQFAERGEGRDAWIDQLCEALGQVGREVLAMGPSVTFRFSSPPKTAASGDGEQSPGMTTILRAADIVDLSEAVMSCSVASPSRDIREVVANSDLVVTGLKELEDTRMAMLIAQRGMLVIPEEEAFPSQRFMERAVVWSDKQSLLVAMIQRIVES